MKRIVICTFILFVAGAARAQQSPLTHFFQKYEDDPAFTVITISPKMFNMFSKVESGDDEAQAILQVAKKLTGLHILTKENASDGMRLFKEASASLSKSYDELMTVRSSGNDLRFLVKDDPDGTIRELIMLIGGNNEFFAMSLTGHIDLDEISRISKDMNIQGFDQLKNVKHKGQDKK